ncbi:MAG: SLC13 family permease [Halobacteria archaeon]|nr:SLC13 family permease [Halobacteria archaeon]
MVALETGMLIVFVLILLATVLFVTEAIPNEITAIGVVVILVVLEPWTNISSTEGISGFANSATVTILAMFILSEGVRRTGIVEMIGRRVSRFTGSNETRQLGATLGLAGPVAGFINNTPVVSMLGGMLTLIGTATNLVASDLSARLIDHRFSMFEFTSLGVVVLLVGSVYLMTVGRWLIPERIEPEQDLTQKFEVREYLTRVGVRGGSPLVGLTIPQVFEGNDIDLDILQIVRGDEAFMGPFTDQRIQENDILTVRADSETLGEFIRSRNLRRVQRAELTDEDLLDEGHTLVEITISPESSLINKTLRTVNFRDRYHGTVLAVRRGGKVIHDDLADLELRAGDSLLVHTTETKGTFIEENPDFVLTRAARSGEDIQLGEEQREEGRGYRRSKTPIAIGILVGVVGVAALGLLPIVIAALGGVVAMVITGCVRTSEAYDAVGWNVIFLLAGIIPLGIAMDETGGAQLLADIVVSYSQLLPPLLMLAIFYVLTGLLSNLITPVATVILMMPIAVDTAAKIGASRFAFVLGVTFAASTAFMTPVGYQTNLMVYTPGGYRFTDYVRVGAPLQLLLAVVTTLGIAFMWGL